MGDADVEMDEELVDQFMDAVENHPTSCWMLLVEQGAV